jgi:quinol monooxygenase YgiN
MGLLVIAACRPKPGKQNDLLQLLREHLPILRGLGLATERPATVMRAQDGTLLEVFEWASQEAIAAAHQNPEVQKLWERFADACDYVAPADVLECRHPSPTLRTWSPKPPSCQSPQLTG